VRPGQTNLFMVEPLPGEEWKQVLGWEGFYEVSSVGRVRSVARKGMGLQPHRRYGGYVLRPGIAPNGYLTFYLVAIGRTRKRVYLHRLVLEAFVGAAPNGHEGCHNNGVRTDCRLSNLRWDTRANNHADKRVHGTTNQGALHVSALLTEDQVRMIRASTLSSGELGRQLHVDSEVVRLARIRRTYANVE
jgi:hypothetical protein